MIIKRLHFPILLFTLLFYSCNKGHKPFNASTNKEYDKNIERGFQGMEKQQYDSAFYYFEKAKITSQSPNQKAYSLLQTATIQQLFCDFSGSESSATEAFENANDSSYMPYIYNLLGIAYEEQNNYDEALKYYYKCYKSTPRELDKCIVKNNIAVVNLEKKDYPKAIKILSGILKNDSLRYDEKQYAKTLDNLGFTYFKTNNLLAIKYLNESLAIRTKLKDDYEVIASYIHLSQYYQKSNGILALQFAQKAYQSATRVNSPDDRIEALKFWIINAEPTQAKKLALKQMALSDSINKVRQSTKNQFAKIKYDSTKAIQEKELSDRQKKNAYIVFAMITLFLISFVIYIRYNNQKKLKASVYETETRLAKKIHDELANDVYQVMTYAETQDLQDTDKKETLLESLDNIYTRTRNISQQNSEIPIGDNYCDTLIDLLNSFNSTKVSVIVNNSQSVQWNTIKKESKIALYRVIQELMVNMKKHSQSSVVIIGFVSSAKTIEIKYSDNGQGTKQIAVSKKGLQNVENRIHDINGTVIFEPETDKGFRVTITIPK